MIHLKKKTKITMAIIISAIVLIFSTTFLSYFLGNKQKYIGKNKSYAVSFEFESIKKFDILMSDETYSLRSRSKDLSFLFVVNYVLNKDKRNEEADYRYTELEKFDDKNLKEINSSSVEIAGWKGTSKNFFYPSCPEIKINRKDLRKDHYQLILSGYSANENYFLDLVNTYFITPLIEREIISTLRFTSPVFLHNEDNSTDVSFKMLERDWKITMPPDAVDFSIIRKSLILVGLPTMAIIMQANNGDNSDPGLQNKRKLSCGIWNMSAPQQVQSDGQRYCFKSTAYSENVKLDISIYNDDADISEEDMKTIEKILSSFRMIKAGKI